MNLKNKEARIKLKFEDRKINIFYAKDVKKAVLDFEKKSDIDYFLNTETDENYLDYIKRIHEEIFGDFENENTN